MGNEEVMQLIYWTSGGLGSLIGVVFFMTLRKVNITDFKDHCKRQAKVNDKLESVIKDNNDLLIRVDERLKAKE